MRQRRQGDESSVVLLDRVDKHGGIHTDPYTVDRASTTGSGDHGRRFLLQSRLVRVLLGVGLGWIILAILGFSRLPSSDSGYKQPSLHPTTHTSPSFEIFAQGPGLTFPRPLLGDKSSSWQRNIDCRQPYRTLPQLLWEESENDDPYLPWIHDYFVTDDGSEIRFIAQNRRRCHTGQNRRSQMAEWEGQIALLQPISVRRRASGTNYELTDPKHADFPETRFQCIFHEGTGGSATRIEDLTFSTYPFNYEYINWRKRGDKPMFVKDGPDVEIVDYATLLFSCPIPSRFNISTRTDNTQPSVYLNLVPIRTPARYDEGYLLTLDQVGPAGYTNLKRLNASAFYGNQTELPPPSRVGRYENLPICPTTTAATSTTQHSNNKKKKQHQLVACAWVAATYERRGGKSSVSDSPQRLREWIAFHRLVGFDHVYVYDNSQIEDENNIANHSFPLRDTARLFPGFVTWIRWPVKVCNNNFIGGRWPGERSSQYAAEASCRERFGPQTEWMSFMDIDEYFVPIQNETWGPILRKKKESPVLGLRESRAKPRFEMMEQLPATDRACNKDAMAADTSSTEDSNTNATCLVPRSKETFLAVYNCDSVKPPRPRGYFTNMKQIYQPDFVLSHFIHYSLITRPIAQYYNDRPDPSKFQQKPQQEEKGLTFLHELKEGILLHARSVLTHETKHWQIACSRQSKQDCKIGFVCPHTTAYKDSLLGKNMFVGQKGQYCNCWKNSHIESWIVKLENTLAELDHDHHQHVYRH